MKRLYVLLLLLLFTVSVQAYDSFWGYSATQAATAHNFCVLMKGASNYGTVTAIVNESGLTVNCDGSSVISYGGIYASGAKKYCSSSYPYFHPEDMEAMTNGSCHSYPAPTGCEAGIAQSFEVSAGASSATACYGGCNYVATGTGTADEYGNVVQAYTSTVDACSLTEADPVDQIEGWNCRLLNGTEYCGLEVEGELCGTVNGINICTAPGNCGRISGGDIICANVPKNCGKVNGEYICVQPVVDGTYGQQNSIPDGCIVDATGNMVCTNSVVKTNESTDVQTSDNGDGTETTTVTTTTSDNVIGTSDVIETIVDDGYGNTTSTTAERMEPEGEIPGAPDFEEITGWQEYIDLMGTAEPGESPFINPLDLPEVSECTQMSFGIAGNDTMFPGPVGCTRLHQLRDILAWVIYLYTFYYLASLAMRRVS